MCSVRNLFLFLVLLTVSSVFAQPFDPVANPKSIVRAGNARFTVLTDRVIRMEYDSSQQFLDLATWKFTNRNLPVPPFLHKMTGDWLIVETKFLQLHYLSSSNVSFNENNLKVFVMMMGNQTTQWSPYHYSNSKGNLLGTIRTLDGINGSVDLDCKNQYRSDLHCTYGLISRDGYVVIDDTHLPRFDNNNWIVNKTYPHPYGSVCKIPDTSKRDCGWPGISQDDCTSKGCCYSSSVGKIEGIPSCYYSLNADQDLYIFGHGLDYKAALQDFSKLSNPIPLPPRYAFGVFYSRYWAYNDVGEMNIVKQYQEHKIPLDVLVTDMDWHITFYKEAAEGKKDQSGHTIGWTGFTFDKRLFPNPDKFFQWCKKRGLKNTLNLHPASGIQPWEEKYPEMAKAMGIDPETQHYVPLNLTDTKFVENWNKIVLAPLEQEGVDFWWLDWQQGEDVIDIPGANPTFWLNYIFFTNQNHWKHQERPMILHRWGGLGNHRYQLGFSGDVVPSWESLNFQPYFTTTASNVGFGYWSHDIGGHTEPSPPELYTRWVQWGIFSPIFRTHCTKNAKNERRIWMYPNENYQIMRDCLILRASLVPYIYTQARIAYDTAISLLRPTYYEYPSDDEAYKYKNQYFFGENFLVAPITTPVDTSTQVSTKEIWIPKGCWMEWFSGELLCGPLNITQKYTLDEIPLFVKSGSIIPRNPPTDSLLGQAQVIPQQLRISVFLGNENNGRFSLYEDDGKTIGYMKGEYAKTSLSYEVSDSRDSIHFTIDRVDGHFEGFPKQRSYMFDFMSVWPAKEVTFNGRTLPYKTFEDEDDSQEDYWTYDGSSLSIRVNIATSSSTNQPGNLQVNFLYPLSREIQKPFGRILKRFIAAKVLLDDQWGIDTVYQEDYPSLLNAAETGRRITYDPSQIRQELKDFERLTLEAITQIQKLHVNASVKNQLLAQLEQFSLNSQQEFTCN